MDINSVRFCVPELVGTIPRNPRNIGQMFLRCGVSTLMAWGREQVVSSCVLKLSPVQVILLASHVGQDLSYRTQESF